jgi:formiminotetrahydrofolate cyclodeaminase
VTAPASGNLAHSAFAELAGRVASADPAPGAGPSAAWTCALAAALVEMVWAVSLRRGSGDTGTATRGRDKAATLRARALELADDDVEAYGEVLAVLRGRGQPGHGDRLVAALSRAAAPPLAIAETAVEVTALAAEAGAAARGAVSGEAVAAAILAEAAVRSCVPLIDLNLGGAPNDARRTRARQLAEAARANLEKVSA